MALALVPVLLSLFASPPPAGDLLVRVVDKDGKPLAGAQVALGTRMETHGHMPPQDMYTDLQKTEAETGCARFSDISRFVKPVEGFTYFVRLGIPATPDVEALLHADKLEEQLTLTMPDCGGVVLHTPCSGKGTALLRVAPAAGSPPPFWRSRQPPAVDLVGGVGRFEYVGLGLELEYRVFGPELPTELRGTFRGPTKKGQVVEYTVKGLEGSPTLLATLVDGELKPIANAQFDWSIGISRVTSSGSSSSSSGGRARSDAKGRVRMPLTGEQAQAGARHLSINAWSDDASAKRLKDAYAALDLPPDFASGELDLAELIVARFGSPGRFLRTDDEALRRAFDAPAERAHFRSGGSEGSAREELLCEMVRRGGPAWEKYVAEHLATLRADPDPFRGSDVGELELLTALRRLQGKPDPLTLAIQPESVLEATFPETPTLVYAMKNVDSEPFAVTEGGSYRSGRFARCNLLATAPDGSALPPREWHSDMLGGMSGRKTLAPGESMGGSLPLGDYVALTMPGTYRMRLRYHDHDDIDSVSEVRGRFVSSSEEFRVQIRPRRVELTQARLDELRGWIGAIDATKTIPLVSGHWHAGMSFAGAATDPEDKLFRAGFEAAPALFAALQDKTLGPERRAWVLGMLWNILGIENPGGFERLQALGKIEWIGKWPTSTEEAEANFGEFGQSSPMEIDAKAQEAFAGVWAKWQALFELKIVP